MCVGGDQNPQPVRKAPAAPVAPVAPIPDQASAAASNDAIVARQRERQQLDAMAGYRSTFASGPRGPGGPTLSDQRAQLDWSPPVLTVDDAARVGPTPVPKATGGGGGGGGDAGGGPSGGAGGGGGSGIGGGSGGGGGGGHLADEWWRRVKAK